MLFLVASALLASPEASAMPSAPVQTAIPAQVAKPKKICHIEEAVIGSLTPKRVCVTLPQTPAPAPSQDAARDKVQQTSSSASGTSN